MLCGDCITRSCALRRTLTPTRVGKPCHHRFRYLPVTSSVLCQTSTEPVLYKCNNCNRSKRIRIYFWKNDDVPIQHILLAMLQVLPVHSALPYQRQHFVQQGTSCAGGYRPSPSSQQCSVIAASYPATLKPVSENAEYIFNSTSSPWVAALVNALFVCITTGRNGFHYLCANWECIIKTDA